MKKVFIFCAFIVAATTLASAQEWLTNYDEALGKAKAENKQVLMDFTGSDWCGWCIKLDKEVFSLPEFKEFATRNLVLLKVDFPQRKPLPAMEKAQNDKLASEFHIEGYPTIVVLNPDGSSAGELGYVPGGPKAFLAELARVAPRK